MSIFGCFSFAAVLLCHVRSALVLCFPFVSHVFGIFRCRIASLDVVLWSYLVVVFLALCFVFVFVLLGVFMVQPVV